MEPRLLHVLYQLEVWEQETEEMMTGFIIFRHDVFIPKFSAEAPMTRRSKLLVYSSWDICIWKLKDASTMFGREGTSLPQGAGDPLPL